MLWSAFLCLALLFAWATGVSAQTSAPLTGAEALKPYQFLVGTWTAEAEMSGGRISIERTYRNVFGGKFLFQTETMRFPSGQVTREMWLGVDPATQALGAWAFSSDGSYAALSGAQSTAEALLLAGRLSGGGDSGVYRSTIQRNGSDAFTHTIEVQKDGAWARYALFTFTRSSSSATAASPRAAGPAAAPLKPLETLAGNWRAEGEADGTRFAVDYAMYWPLAGHFLRSDYTVTTNGKEDFQAASYMFLDPETNTLRQIGFRADGSISNMKIAPSAASVLFDGQLVTPAAVTAEQVRRTPTRITYARPDAGSITITTEAQRADGTWRRAGAVTLKRRP